jgi:hypothetical protein
VELLNAAAVKLWLYPVAAEIHFILALDLGK